MKLLVQIMDDDGTVKVEHTADPCQPSQWRATPGNALVGKMPAQSDQANTGTYELFGFTFQPNVRVNRPNGYTAPVPAPNTALPQSFPNPMKPPPFGLAGQKPASTPWGKSAPTPAPQFNTALSRG